MKEKAQAAATELRKCVKKAMAQQAIAFFILRVHLTDAEGPPIY